MLPKPNFKVGDRVIRTADSLIMPKGTIATVTGEPKWEADKWYMVVRHEELIIHFNLPCERFALYSPKPTSPHYVGKFAKSDVS